MLDSTEPPRLEPLARTPPLRARLRPSRIELPAGGARQAHDPAAHRPPQPPPRRIWPAIRARLLEVMLPVRESSGRCGPRARPRGRDLGSIPPSTAGRSATPMSCATATAFSTSPLRPAGSRISRPARADARRPGALPDEEARRSPRRWTCPTDEQRRTRIAWLYYVEGMTQAGIADCARLSRVKVGAICRSAAVRPRPDPDQWPPRLLRGPGAPAGAPVRPKEAVVVPTPADPGYLPATLGIALGTWLTDRLRPGRPSASAGAARSTGASAPCAAATFADLTVVALLGGHRPRLGDQHLRDRLAFAEALERASATTSPPPPSPLRWRCATCS